MSFFAVVLGTVREWSAHRRVDPPGVRNPPKRTGEPMASLRRSGPKRLVLDVGTSAVRLCELVPTKTGYQLTRYFQREFEIDPSMEEEEQNEQRVEILRTLLKEAKAGSKKAIVGVPGQSVFMRPRALPPVPAHKVNQIVRYEILQQIPFSIDQIAYDYQVLKQNDAGGYEVLMAAIKVDVVEKCLKPVLDLKRRIGTVDVCPLAAYNWLKHTGEFGGEGECVALIDLGASTTDIVIEREEQFRFPRSINAGGNDITQAMAAKFDLPFAEAERLKRERGFAPTGDAARDGKGGEVIGQALTRLVGEINRSFAYFRSQPGGGPVSRVVLTGGGACLRNIVPYMQRELGVEVRIAQPLTGLVIAPEAQDVNENPEQAAVVLGMALRSCEDVPVAIDLIPPRVLERARRREQVLWWSFIVLTMVAIMFSVVPVRERQNQQHRQQIAEYEKVIKKYDPAFAKWDGSPRMFKSAYEKQLSNIEGQLREHQGRVGMMDTWFKARIQWLKYVNAINDARIQVLEEAQTKPRTEGDEAPSGTPVLVLQVLESAKITPVQAGENAAPNSKNPYQCTGYQAPNVTGGSTAGLGGGQDASSAPRVVVPNALIIRGFTSSPELLLAFKVALEAVVDAYGDKIFTDNGVYSDPKDSNLVNWSVLSAAPSANRAPAVRENLGDSGREGRGFGGLAARASGANVGSSRGGSAEAFQYLRAGWPTLRDFRMDLQFVGEGIPDAKRVAGAPGGGAGRAVSGTRNLGRLESFRNRGTGDEEESAADSEEDEE